MTNPTVATTGATGLDWDAIRAALARAEIALEDATHADDARGETLLAERAAALASRRTETAARSAVTRVLVVSAAKERFGLAVGSLREVLPRPTLTPLPRAPRAVCGVANVSGDVRSVVSLAALLGLELPADSAPGFLVVTRHDTRVLVLLVDTVERIAPVVGSALESLAGGGEGREHLLLGVADGGFAVVDTAALFAHPVVVGRSNEHRIQGGSP